MCVKIFMLSMGVVIGLKSVKTLELVTKMLGGFQGISTHQRMFYIEYHVRIWKGSMFGGGWWSLTTLQAYMTWGGYHVSLDNYFFVTREFANLSMWHICMFFSPMHDDSIRFTSGSVTKWTRYQEGGKFWNHFVLFMQEFMVLVSGWRLSLLWFLKGTWNF